MNYYLFAQASTVMFLMVMVTFLVIAEAMSEDVRI